jgi:putative hydrolase of the HAD superfamily
MDDGIQGVIVDFGGVLAKHPTEEAVARLCAAGGFDAEVFADAWHRHRLPYDLGKITAADYWSLVGGRSYDVELLERLLAEDAEAWATQNEPIVDWLGTVKAAGLRLALLSNMPREVWARLADRLAWLELCDVVTLSYELELAKPDAAIYRACLDRLGVAHGRTLFVDDRPENVEAAETLGLQAVLFTDVDALRSELRSRFGDRVPLP